MIKVGITGGIGSGKTTICNCFKLIGIPVFHADIEAKRLMIEDKELMKKIKSNFGEEAYISEGVLNRSYLSSIIFSDDQKRVLMNSLVHPCVNTFFDKWIKSINSDSSYILYEAAILFESNSYKKMDCSVVVYAPEFLRIMRAQRRDSATYTQVKSRVDAQWKDEELVKLADYKIIADDILLVLPQVLQIDEKIKERYGTIV